MNVYSVAAAADRSSSEPARPVEHAAGITTLPRTGSKLGVGFWTQSEEVVQGDSSEKKAWTFSSGNWEVLKRKEQEDWVEIKNHKLP